MACVDRLPFVELTDALLAIGKFDDCAARLKADDNGMKTYVMALLKAGPNRNRPREEAQKR